MPLANFSNLDFDQVKITLQDYLKSNSNFTDYDFEGSNLSTILDVLAYNTYITSYNANMITNEVFIDTATLRENVISLARNIGYVPRPRQAARAGTYQTDTGSKGTGTAPASAGTDPGTGITRSEMGCHITEGTQGQGRARRAALSCSVIN